MTTVDPLSATGQVQTVIGSVDPATLGITLMHEHLLVDSRGVFYEQHPDPPPGVDGPVSLDNRWWLIHHPKSNLDNMLLDSVEQAAYEIGLLEAAPGLGSIAGRTVVDVSCIGLRVECHALRLRELMRTTNTTVVMGTGWYVKRSHPAALADMDEDAMVDVILREVTEGVDGTDVRAGIIGEVGVSAPFDDVERRVLRASAEAQRTTGVPISVHPGAGDDVLLDIVETLRDAGADLANVVLCHQDATGHSRDVRLEVAAAGCTLGFDTFGYTELRGIAGSPPVPSDAQRVADLEFFIGEGLVSQMIVSHDVFYKHRSASFGGSGYSHILRNVVPEMRVRGVTEDQLRAILVDNPARALTFERAA